MFNFFSKIKKTLFIYHNLREMDDRCAVANRLINEIIVFVENDNSSEAKRHLENLKNVINLWRRKYLW